MLDSRLAEIIEKIAKFGNTSKEEVQRRIEAKKEALGGLISYEGAAQIVAAELGIRFDSIKLNLSDLLPGMRKVNVIGKIVELYPIRNYRKGDKELKLASFLLADSTDAIRVVLWDTKHIALIEQGKIKEGDTVEISNGFVRGDMNSKEIHLTGLSDIALSSIKLEQIVEKEKYPFKLIAELTLNTRAKIKANIVQAFSPSFYDFCLVCNKKAENCGHAEFEKRGVFAFIVDDGSESIRCIAFNDTILKILGIDSIDEISSEASASEKASEKLQAKLQAILGDEFWFVGRVRKNTFRDRLEFVVDDAEQVDVKELIEKLQSSSLK